VILSRAGLEPTFVIGGDLNESGSGAQHGSGEVFVAEADESDGSILLLEPEIGVVTNVDEDHLDFYRDAAEIEAAFGAFAERSGTTVACWDDLGVRRALSDVNVRLVRFGAGEDVDVRLIVDERWATGSRGRVQVQGQTFELELAVPGRYNLMNATAALTTAWLLDVPPEDVAVALGSFTGVRRRFDVKGSARGATFIDDYAHNPGKLAAVLESARAIRTGDPSGGGQRVVAVFQPHRYTRTQALWRALGQSLRWADVVVVTDVYGAGELPIPGVTGKLVVDSLAESAPGKRVIYVPRRADLATFLAREVRDGDLVLTLGAGDITMVGEETLERLREMTG
jgi:UDP-N-acetylmuramate--alanine ligase